MPRLSFLTRLALVALLCAAWQSALVHPITHVDRKGGFVHLAGGHPPASPGKHGGASGLCDAIAAVAVCVGGSPLPAVASIGGVESVPPAAPGSARSALSLAYRSQAPPVVL